MSASRRDFLKSSSVLFAAAASAQLSLAQEPPASPPQQPPSSAQPGAPPAFGTAPPAGPEVSAGTFAEAEKLVRVEMTEKDRQEAALNWRQSMAALNERRNGPRKVAIPDGAAPYSQVNPVLPGHKVNVAGGTFVRTESVPPLPAHDADIAFSPVWKLARWLESRKLTSERLTTIYLARLEKFNPQLRCVITPTRDLALAQAQLADREIAAGHYRGPMHGMPYGLKDLLDTAGVATTYGAEPYRDRVPAKNATVVSRLEQAGGVLLAKLSLGALALNDVWFGGQTMNPWLPDAEGSSGSSAGPGAATSAGLVAFAIGSETEGSITSPSARCGIVGLRPTFGRVPRTGAMTLCWSLDKLGPMTRSVEDTMLVLQAIAGPDEHDLGSVAAPLAFDAQRGVKGLRVGYFPKWMEEPPASDVDKQALAQLEKLGLTPVKVALPDWPFDDLNVILFAEAAAAFEELTLSRQVDQLRMQTPDAWPNTFRQSRFLSAVDFVQADRLRRMVAQEMERLLTEVDLLLVPSLRDEMLCISNFTGQPSLTLRAGFVKISEARSDWAPDPQHPLAKFDPPRRVPQAVTLIGRLFDEGTIASVGLALERSLKVMDERPPGF